MASESADNINVAVALSTALLLPNDLERNGKLSEYENYALMLQHSAQREASSMEREIRALEAKMKKLEDQAEAATKVQTLALEKVEAAEAVKKVAEAEKRKAEARKAQAEKELQPTLFLPFPPPPPEGESESEADAVDEDEEQDDGDALVRKPKDAAEAKSPPPAEQVINLTLDEEGDEVEGAPKETATGELSSNLPLIERSVEESLAEIDAEIQAEKVADEVPLESSEVPVPAVANIEEA
ncbi:uncharacterized abhydrolase domain-containing protein DDB_G0269086-like [Camellia sinensis]|uniref:uncharacterized abhydrolase domain-containing protein DDB_G0269086-like n=1 Tax=Camellia sinensis TaxID=4442 RepID=UPI0010368DB4|nr:uncharacterized abhydrolase domain-containing protein DDB_G0269086-like [Camellia sinensis]